MSTAAAGQKLKSESDSIQHRL